MENKIETVNIYINQCDGLSCHKDSIKESYPPFAEDKERGVHTPKDAPSGVYIYTDNGYCISPDFYGLHKLTVTPIGIAVIASNRSLLVALRGSDSGIVLSDKNNACKTANQFDSVEKALTDWDGKGNTAQLAKSGSPAAKHCLDYEIGNIKKGSWWLPSLAELNLMYNNKALIDACLAICGGEILQGYWHWSSTEHSKCANWVLSWNDGLRSSNLQLNLYRVRPVSAFL